MTGNRFYAEYRGYALVGRSFPAHWEAWVPGSTFGPWFEAPTQFELREAIDEALASLPPPVY